MKSDGIRLNPDNLKIVQECRRPKSLTEVSSFVRLLQFFRRKTKGFLAIAHPLTSQTKKESGIQDWDEKYDRAFDHLKMTITSASILISPRWDKPFRCHVDGSFSEGGGRHFNANVVVFDLPGHHQDKIGIQSTHGDVCVMFRNNGKGNEAVVVLQVDDSYGYGKKSFLTLEEDVSK